MLDEFTSSEPDFDKENHDDSSLPEDVLTEAFRNMEPQLLGMLYHVLGNREDASDAMQETFIRCWNRKETLDEIVNLRAWIFRIAYNISVDFRRSAWRRRKKPLPEDEAILMSVENQPDAILSEREEIALLRRAIMQLDDDEKEVFLLRQNGLMDFNQVAQAIGIPVGTAKTRMRRAIRKLHGLLDVNEEN